GCLLRQSIHRTSSSDESIQLLGNVGRGVVPIVLVCASNNAHLLSGRRLWQGSLSNDVNRLIRRSSVWTAQIASIPFFYPQRPPHVITAPIRIHPLLNPELTGIRQSVGWNWHGGRKRGCTEWA